eukprot:TRINITY_DN13741_c0_g4_i1.p1 TRINITY_DN13741_c0_g4~~TRINITY_DN13741_c0_g4_i1.p1  ORF type:complete len:196 (+),score=20.05 TRINITY_DN13741_c0_g4_i1:62-589(+)
MYVMVYPVGHGQQLVAVPTYQVQQVQAVQIAQPPMQHPAYVVQSISPQQQQQQQCGTLAICPPSNALKEEKRPVRRPSEYKCTERPPCGHNQWVREPSESGKRVKRKPVLLACMVCPCIWKTKLRLHVKCPRFFSGSCDQGSQCPYPHIYSRKKVPICSAAEDSDEDDTPPPLKF